MGRGSCTIAATNSERTITFGMPDGRGCSGSASGSNRAVLSYDDAFNDGSCTDAVLTLTAAPN
jgi:hypothetical protein